MEGEDVLAPRRPEGVPAPAVWVPESEHWELVASGPNGQKQGEVRIWRSDGSLYMTGRYAGGVLEGSFAIYHPSGELARQGTYAGGELHGALTAVSSDSPTPEELRGCCVPDNAWRLSARYDTGRLRHEEFLDREGRPLLSDGALRPAHPETVPREATFLEWERRWALGATDAEGNQEGSWRYFTEEGRLDEEAEHRQGRKTFSRRYEPSAGSGNEVAQVRQVKEEAHFGDNGIRHGLWMRRHLPGESPWSDARVVEERGFFDGGQMAGRWIFLDRAGKEVRAIDYGRAFRAEDLDRMEVLRGGPRPADAWRTLAGVLRTEGRLREAVCAAARAAAADDEVGLLRTFLAENTLSLTADAAARLGAELMATEENGVQAALGALVGGADPVTALRTLASRLKGADRAAHDFAQAAVLLDPERTTTYLTRALVRIELGDPAGAGADASVVGRAAPDVAASLREVIRVLFPSFSFWPAREPPESALPDLPEAPEQPLEAIRRAIQVYATRLMQLRAALRDAVGTEAAWMPPDLAQLLPDGPLPLTTHTASITDETEQGPETVEVAVEEALEVPGQSVPALMRLARAHWAGLCWLCWSAGLDEIALPRSLAPPDRFAQAIGMAITRCWRAQDALATGGLRSATAGIPGFSWEGMEIDAAPKLLAEIAHDEYVEMRSVLLYLASSDNLSPFQSDLRQQG